MAKIDLTGNSGWQSKSSDKLKDIQSGAYDHHTVTIMPDNITTEWLEKGIMVQVEEGELTLKIDEEEMKYEAGEVIVLNEENSVGTEVLITEKLTLQIFKPK